MGCGSSKATSTAAVPLGASGVVRTQQPLALRQPASPRNSTPAAPAAAAEHKPVSAPAPGASGYATKQRLHDLYDVSNDVLGRGGFGEVRRGSRKSDGALVAVKTISKLQFKSEQDHKDMLTEVRAPCALGRRRRHCSETAGVMVLRER
jgi:hypothetical protein